MKRYNKRIIIAAPITLLAFLWLVSDRGSPVDVETDEVAGSSASSRGESLVALSAQARVAIGSTHRADEEEGHERSFAGLTERETGFVREAASFIISNPYHLTDTAHGRVDLAPMRTLVAKYNLTASQLNELLESEDVTQQMRRFAMLALPFTGELDPSSISQLGSIAREVNHDGLVALFSLGLCSSDVELNNIAFDIWSESESGVGMADPARKSMALRSLVACLRSISGPPDAHFEQIFEGCKYENDMLSAAAWACALQDPQSNWAQDAATAMEIGNAGARIGLEDSRSRSSAAELFRLAEKRGNVWERHCSNSSLKGLLSIGTSESIGGLVELAANGHSGVQELLRSETDPLALSAMLALDPRLFQRDELKGIDAAVSQYVDNAMASINSDSISRSDRKRIASDIEEIIGSLPGNSQRLLNALTALALSGGKSSVSSIRAHAMRMDNGSMLFQELRAMPGFQ